MWCLWWMHCQDGCVFAWVGHAAGAPTRLWGLVYIIWSPFALHCNILNTHMRTHGGKGIIVVVTSDRLTRAIGTITIKDLRLTCPVKDLWRYGWMRARARAFEEHYGGIARAQSTPGVASALLLSSAARVSIGYGGSVCIRAGSSCLKVLHRQRSANVWKEQRRVNMPQSHTQRRGWDWTDDEIWFNANAIGWVCLFSVRTCTHTQKKQGVSLFIYLSSPGLQDLCKLETVKLNLSQLSRNIRKSRLGVYPCKNVIEILYTGSMSVHRVNMTIFVFIRWQLLKLQAV